MASAAAIVASAAAGQPVFAAVRTAARVDETEDVGQGDERLGDGFHRDEGESGIFDIVFGTDALDAGLRIRRLMGVFVFQLDRRWARLLRNIDQWKI